MSQQTISSITLSVLDAVLNATNSTEDQSDSNLKIVANTFMEVRNCSRTNVSFKVVFCDMQYSITNYYNECSVL